MSGAKTYSRSKECLSEKGNKPSTAKVSVAGIHRWGMTSYTSLRKARLNGERQKEATTEEPAKRPKLDDDPFGFEAEPSRPPAEPAKPRPNKFFKSGSRAAAKNSEFDALRLSVPPAFNSGGAKDLFVNIKPPPPVYLASDLRYTEPPRYTPPSVHYIRPLPPVDGSAFDALISLDLSAKQDAFREGDIFGASSQESLKDTAYGTSSQESCKDVLFGASSQESLKDTAYGTSSQESCKDVLFGAESNRDASYGASSQESHRDASYGASSQESELFGASSDVLFGQKPRKEDVLFGSREPCKDRIVYGTSSRQVFGASESRKDVLFGVSSLKDTSYGTSSQESCKDVPFGAEDKDASYGASSQELFGASSDVLFGASSQKPRKDGKDSSIVYGAFGASSQECVDYSASSQESKKDDFFDRSRARTRHTAPPGRNHATVVQACEEAAFGASSQESCKDEFLAPMDTDSGPLTQDSLLGSQLDFPSSQSSDKSFDSSGNAKQGARHKKIFSSSSKFKAVYNHRHWHSSKKAEEAPEEKAGGLADEFEEEMAKENFHSHTNSSEIAPYKCPKASKEFYTVVKNVKQAYQCHESGETQEFNDDIEYLLECVQECNAIGTRCLSVLNLAAKCMSPAFRIHLRAHGTMPKIFSALQDAPRDPNLSLCTAALMFVLSQDRLTMDIEASTLSLMLQLLEEEREVEPEAELILSDPALAAMQDRHRERVAGLCEEMRLKGHAKHLKMDNINTGILAMETLLSLTSRKAGEWFKEEMRTLRGLDRIADTVTLSTESLLPDEQEVVRRPSEAQLDKIRKIDRCLRVLENVTHLNPENQEYLLTYKDSLLISSCLQLLRLFKTHLLAQPQGEGGGDVVSCLLNLLKILSNITYGIALDDSMFPPGDGLMDQLLMLILQVPRAVSTEKRFDLLVLSLGLMINLVEYCGGNSAKFVQMHALGSFEGVNDGYEMLATEALVELMCERLECARLSEEQADELLSTQEAKHAERKDAEAAADDLEETLMKTLQKAGKHMEHSIVAAYIVILLGCVSQKHPDFIQVMKDFVPNGNFDIMVEVLKKFKSFVSLTGSVGNRELGSIQKVIHLLESS